MKAPRQLRTTCEKCGRVSHDLRERDDMLLCRQCRTAARHIAEEQKNHIDFVKRIEGQK